MKNLINRASTGAKKTNYIFKARWLQEAASANESKKMQVNPRITLIRFACALDSLACRLRVLPSRGLRMAAMLCMLLTLSIGCAWGAEDDTAYTLTCTQNSSNTGYASSFNVTINSKNWSAPGNQNAGSGWRVGGAKGTNVSRYITGKSTIDKPIKKITVNHNGRSNSNLTINSFSVTVSKNSDFSSPIETKTVTSPSVSSAGSFDLTPTSSPWPSGCYYKFTLVYTHSKSSNYGLDLTSLVFVEGASGGGSTCATPTFSPAAGTYCGSQSVTISSSTTGSTIYYTTDNSTPTTSSSHGTAGAASATITVSSSQTLKAIAVKDGMSNSATGSAAYTINNIANTQETAYTVAEARALIDANVCLTQQVYVKGYVSEIVTAYNGTYGNISFNITDNSDGTGDTFEFFRNFKGSGNTRWASAEEVPQVGNYVVGYGTLTKYSSTYELAEGNYCVVNSSYTITAISNNDSYGTVSLTGKVITATPESGYRVSTTTAYTVTSGTATVTDNGDGTFTVTPSSDCTVRINFEALPTYTVTLMDDGDTRTQASAGASVTLPSRDGCEGYTFAGWTKSWTEEQDEWTTTAPTIIPAGSYTPTDDENLYPVYTKTEDDGGGSTTAQLTNSEMITNINAAATAYGAEDETTYDDTSDGVVWSGIFSANAGGHWIQLRQNATPAYLKISAGGNISEVVVTVTSGSNKSGEQYNMTSGYNAFTSAVNVYLATANTAGDENANVVATATTNTTDTYQTLTLTPSSDSFNELYIISSGGCRVWLIDVTYSSATTYYISVPDCTSPTIVADKTSLAFDDTKVNGSSTMTFSVRGSNLTNNISLAISGTNADMFSIDKSTLTPTDGSVSSTTVTVTYSPTSTGSHSAQINLTSSGATTKTIALTGTGKWAVTWMVDGEVYETTLVSNAARPTFPDNPDSFDATSSEFYGWSTAEWKGRIDDLTDKTVYTSNSSMATVNTSGRTYYAVFAKPKYAEGSAPVNTVLWAEDFSGFGDTDVPSGDITNSHTGTTVYGDNTVTYTCVNGGSNTQLHGGNETLYAGGVKPELLVGKSTGTFTVGGIPSGGSSVLTVSYKQNNKSLTVTASGTGYSGSNTANTTATQSFDVNVGSVSTFTLTFAATTTDNVRLDDIEVIVKTRSVTYSRYMTNSREDMYVTSAKDIMTQASMTMTINRSAIKSGSVTIADVAGSQGGAFHAVITNGTANASTGLNATVEIQYTPTKANVSESATMTVTIGAVDSYTFTVYGRSLPAEFAIVGKVGAAWTALPADALSSGLQAGYGLTVDDADDPTEATLAPEAALFKYYARTTKGNDYIRLAGAEKNLALWSSTSNGIKVWAAIDGGSATGNSYEWKLATTDNVTYTLWNAAAGSGSGRNLGINSDKKWGMHATPTTDVLRFLPVTSTAAYIAMTVTNWGTTSFTFTTGDVIPSYSSITVLYHDVSYSATMSGSGPYTLNITGIDFTAYQGEQLVVQWKDGSGNSVAQGAIITPIFIASANTDFAGCADLDMLSNCDVRVTNGATLTITTNGLHVHDLTIEGGATLNIGTTGGDAGVTFNMNSLSLRGGWTTIGGSPTYDMPRVYINPASTLSKTSNTVNFDISVNKSNYYPFAVPFRVKVSDIDYADAYLATYSTYKTHYVIKEYDGASRAANGAVPENWKVVEQKDELDADVYLEPGKGYILTAVPVGGEAVIRFPMSFTNAWTTGGEKGSVTVAAVTTTKNAIPVSAHSSTDKRHAGWNLLGVPFMACYKTDDGMHNEDDGFITGKMILTGNPANPFGWEDDGAVYVSVPTHDFSEYIQFDITDEDTKLLPGWCFFMQMAKSGTLTFDVSDQQASSSLPIYAPKRATAEQPTVRTGIILSDAEASDKTTILVSDKYSSDYEIGADLEKMFGNASTLATYSIAGNTPLAYNAMSTTDAQQVIPIGFRAPENGEYTFSLNPRYDNGAMERVDLIDKQEGTLTNLLMESYTFTTTLTRDDERFELNIVPAKKVATEIENGSDEASRKVEKVIVDGTMFIIRDQKMYDVTGKRVYDINK